MLRRGQEARACARPQRSLSIPRSAPLPMRPRARPSDPRAQPLKAWATLAEDSHTAPERGIPTTGGPSPRQRRCAVPAACAQPSTARAHPAAKVNTSCEHAHLRVRKSQGPDLWGQLPCTRPLCQLLSFTATAAVPVHAHERSRRLKPVVRQFPNNNSTFSFAWDPQG